MNHRPVPVRIYARTIGLLLLVSVAAGFLGEFYAPSRVIVSNDAATTARNLTGSALLFRLGFAGYLIEAFCDLTLALMFYLLLKPVQRELALLAAFFGILATALYAVAELFYFAAPLVLRGGDGLTTFTPDQRNALALLSLKLFGLCAGIFMAFYGIATLLRGYLIYRSGFLPRWLGALLALAGAGFIVRNFALVLAPACASDLLIFPMMVAAVALMAWLLVRGVDVAKWEARAGVLRT